MKKRVFKIIKRAFLCLVVIALLICLPFVSVNKSDNLSLIFSAFVGKKSDYQGMIVVWNIDTFESGTAAKSNYLSSVARTFEKNNKGVYVMVRNLTEFECYMLLQKGEMPDLFSCSYSVIKKIQDYIQAYSSYNDISIRSNFIESGMVEGKLMALPWCAGAYTLLASNESLSKAKINIEEVGLKLSSIALSSGYEYETKKGTNVVSSLTYGAGGKLLTQKAFTSYTGIGLDFSSRITVDENSESQSQYSAYASFLAGNSTILLGTQRDVARLEGRLEQGKISGLFYELVSSSSDLVQFCLLAKSESKERLGCSEAFAKLLVSAESQQKIGTIGMIPVCEDINPYSSGIMKDIVSQISDNFRVFHIFEDA